MDIDLTAKAAPATAPVSSSSRPQVVVAAPRGASVFLPVCLLAVAFVGWLGFQAVQQWSERQQLAALETNLGPQELAANKVRASLDAVAGATAKLAADGNPSARVLVEELRKRGVTLGPQAPKAP